MDYLGILQSALTQNYLIEYFKRESFKAKENHFPFNEFFDGLDKAIQYLKSKRVDEIVQHYDGLNLFLNSAEKSIATFGDIKKGHKDYEKLRKEQIKYFKSELDKPHKVQSVYLQVNFGNWQTFEFDKISSVEIALMIAKAELNNEFNQNCKLRIIDLINKDEFLNGSDTKKYIEYCQLEVKEVNPKNEKSIKRVFKYPFWFKIGVVIIENDFLSNKYFSEDRIYCFDKTLRQLLISVYDKENEDFESYYTFFKATMNQYNKKNILTNKKQIKQLLDYFNEKRFKTNSSIEFLEKLL